MGKNQSASNLTNIIQYNNGNIAFVSGSTTLMQISSSGAITTTGVISGSNALSASYAATASFVTTAQTASFVTLAQTASFVTTAQTASFVTLAQTASFVANAQSASNAVTAQTASFANAFTVAGTLTAQTLVVQTITSSVDYVTGSTRFGSLLTNTHVFSGSVTMNPGGLFVSGSGLVGIGTTSPSAKLHVQGTSYFFDQSIFGDKLGIGISSPSYVLDVSGSGIRLKNSGGSADFLLDRASTSAGSTFQYLTAGTLKWYTGLRGLANDNFYIFNNATSTNTLVIDSSTNDATLTTTNNQGGLTVTSAQDNTTIRIASTATGGQEWRIQSTGGTSGLGQGKLFFKVGTTETGANIPLVLYTDNSTNGGRVGIGVTSPSYRLDVNGDTQLRGDLIFNKGSRSTIYPATSGENLHIKANGGGALQLMDDAAGNIQMVNGGGKVGIGTTTPNAQGLTIYQGGSDRRIMLELNRPNSPGLQSAIQFTVGSSILVGQIQHEYVTDNYNHMSFTLRSPGGGNFVSMWLQNSGNVGIGTSSPATKLHVAGAIGNGTSTYPQNVRLVKTGTTSVTFTLSIPYAYNWNPAYATIRVAGSRTGLEEQYAALYFVRLTYYAGSISSVVYNVAGDTGNASVGISPSAPNNAEWVITVSDGGATTNYLIADIDVSVNGGIISIS